MIYILKNEQITFYATIPNFYADSTQHFFQPFSGWLGGRGDVAYSDYDFWPYEIGLE